MKDNISKVGARNKIEISGRRYSLSQLISESYQTLYNCSLDSKLYKLTESHIVDIKNNPEDTTRLSHNLEVLKGLVSLGESAKIRESDIPVEDEEEEVPMDDEELEEDEEFPEDEEDFEEEPDEEDLDDSLASRTLARGARRAVVGGALAGGALAGAATGALAGKHAAKKHMNEEDELEDEEFEDEELEEDEDLEDEEIPVEDEVADEDPEITPEELQELKKHLREIRRRARESAEPDLNDPEEAECPDRLKKTGRFPESRSWRSEKVSMTKALKNFRESSNKKAFYKSFAKLHERMKESAPLTLEESILLYKASNSAMTHLAVELEHNPGFIYTFRECTAILEDDNGKLLECIRKQKSPAKSLIESYRAFSSILLESEDFEDEIEDDDEDVILPDEEEDVDEGGAVLAGGAALGAVGYAAADAAIDRIRGLKKAEVKTKKGHASVEFKDSKDIDPEDEEEDIDELASPPTPVDGCIPSTPNNLTKEVGGLVAKEVAKKSHINEDEEEFSEEPPVDEEDIDEVAPALLVGGGLAAGAVIGGATSAIKNKAKEAKVTHVNEDVDEEEVPEEEIPDEEVAPEEEEVLTEEDPIEDEEPIDDDDLDSEITDEEAEELRRKLAEMRKGRRH